MSLLLLNVVLWPLAVLVAVPLVIHLFARARPPKLEFSSVEFIRRALRMTQRVRKPRDWLLLLIRTAAAAAIVFLFLRPVLFSHGAGSLFERRNVVVILDASASMGWSEGSQTRFAVACAEASEILAGLSSRDAAGVILASATPRAVLPVLGSNLGYLQGEVRRAKLTHEALEAGSAIKLAARLLEGQEGRREICVISDFQATSWRGIRPGLPPDIGLTCVEVARREAPNTALVQVSAEPTHPLVGEEVEILCEAANFSGAPQRKAVVLAVGAARSSREIVIPAWGRSTVVFRQRVDSVAPFVVAASLGEDAFPVDDRRWLAVEPSDGLRVGIMAAGTGTATAEAWMRVCRALGWVKPFSLTREALKDSQSRCDVLMVAGWDGTEPEPVRQWLAEGTPVVWYPAAGMPTARITGVLTNGGAAGAEGVVVGWESKAGGVRLSVSAPEHPVFRVFAGGEFGDPARGRVHRRLTVPTTALPTGDALLCYSDGVPALWLCRGGAPLLLWTFPLEKAFSSVAEQGEFVPFMGELLLGLRRGSGVSMAPDSRMVCGQVAAWRPGVECRADEVSLRAPDGVPIPLVGAGGQQVSEPLAQPGVYDWMAGERVLRRSVVNISAAESDLRPLSGTEIKTMGAVTASSGREARDWQAGIPLWPRLLWIALALLLCEGAITASGSFRRRQEGAV